MRDINKQVADVEVPLSYMEEFYHLRLHLTMLQEQLEKLRAQQGPPPAPEYLEKVRASSCRRHDPITRG